MMNYPAPMPEAAPMQPPQEAPSFASTTQYRISRPGARPLTFSGNELAMAMSYTPELPYWYEINVYHTDAQTFALAVRLFFQSEEIEDTTQAWEFDTIIEVFDTLEAYDAAKDLRVSFVTSPSDAPADLLAHAMDLRSQISAARAHFASLIGEFFDTLDQAAA